MLLLCMYPPHLTDDLLKPLFRSIVGLDGFALYNDVGVVALDVPTFGGHGSCDVTTRQRYAGDCDNQDLFHIVAKMRQKWTMFLHSQARS